MNYELYFHVISNLLGGLAIFLFGIPSALSGGQWFGSGFKAATGRAFFDWVDHLTVNWMLPLGGLAIAIFTGYFSADDEPLRIAGSATAVPYMLGAVPGSVVVGEEQQKTPVRQHCERTHGVRMVDERTVGAVAQAFDRRPGVPLVT